MAGRDTTFQVVQTNPDGTIVVRPTSETALTAPDSSLPVVGGYRAQIGGRVINFASERDYQEASAAWRDEMSRQGRGGYGGNGTSSGASVLRTGADAAEAINGFFTGRNLRKKRTDLLDSLDAEQSARDKLGQLQGKYGDLIPILLDWIGSEQQVLSTSISVLDDQIFALDIQSGVGVVRTMSDLWDGYSSRGGGGFGGSGNALAIGALGLGIGFLLSNTGGRGRRR